MVLVLGTSGTRNSYVVICCVRIVLCVLVLVRLVVARVVLVVRLASK